MDTSALVPVPTVTMAVALLFARVGSLVVALTEGVSAITVPEAVPAFTCTTSENGALAAAFSVASVQVNVVVEPTGGVAHVHEPAVSDWKFVFGGMVSVRVSVLAFAGPLLVTVWANVTFAPAATLLADGVLVMARSACPAVATIVVVVAVLFALLVSVAELTVKVSVIVVPAAVPALTCTTGENVVAPGGRVAIVQVRVPAPPTTRALQAHPAGGTKERKFVLAGITSVNVTLAALLGPGLVTTCV